MKLLTSIFIGLCLSLFGLVAAQPVWAGTDLTVDCLGGGGGCSITPGATPLFNETNILPGDEFMQVVTAKNSSAANGTFAIEALNLTDSGISALLSNVITIEIREGSAAGPVLYGPITLKNLITPDPHYVLLSGVSAFSQKDYYFIARFDINAGNEYQRLASVFDLRLGFELLPASSPTPGTPGGGGGGGTTSGGGGGGTTTPTPPKCEATAPTAAPNVTITSVGNNTVSLSWSPISGVTHYGIAFTRISDGAQYGSTNIGNVTSYTVTNLSGGANYRFEVFGVNDCAPGPHGGATTGNVPGPFIAGRPTGPSGEVLGVTTESPSPSPSPAGQVAGAETEAACIQWKLYIPWILLVMQFFFVLAAEYFFRKDRKYTKFYVVIGITLASIFIFYLIRECNCYNTKSFLAWLCKWYWLVALLITAFLRAVSYAFIEEVQDKEAMPNGKQEKPAPKLTDKSDKTA